MTQPNQPATQPQPIPPPQQRRPVREITAGAIAGALGVILVWIASLTGLEVPEPVTGALVLLLTAGVAALTPLPRTHEQR